MPTSAMDRRRHPRRRAIGVDRSLAGCEEWKSDAGERVQRGPLGLDRVPPGLPAGRAVNTKAHDCAIPVPDKRILRVGASKVRPLSALPVT